MFGRTFNAYFGSNHTKLYCSTLDFLENCLNNNYSTIVILFPLTTVCFCFSLEGVNINHFHYYYMSSLEFICQKFLCLKFLMYILVKITQTCSVVFDFQLEKCTLLLFEACMGAHNFQYYKTSRLEYVW